MTTYYNELEPFAVAWLRNLAAAGHISPGRIDGRSIKDVQAADLTEHTRAHFFAGVGGWERALDLAGVPADLSVWTGSCPCQPFSSAGAKRGTADERHLWPVWRRLIDQCKPAVIFGEQVASPLGRTWLAAVRADLEALGYVVGAADLCAAGAGAPHIRQRLWFGAVHRSAIGRLADSYSAGLDRERPPRLHDQGARRDHDGGCGPAERLGHPGSDGDREHAGELPAHEGKHVLRGTDSHHAPVSPSVDNGLADMQSGGCGVLRGTVEPGQVRHPDRSGDASERLADAAGGQLPQPGRGTQTRDGARPVGSDPAGGWPSSTAGDWSTADWLFCRDAKWRSVEPGTFPLVDGLSTRVGRLRAYGNAIVPQVAAAFVESFIEAVVEGVTE